MPLTRRKTRQAAIQEGFENAIHQMRDLYQVSIDGLSIAMEVMMREQTKMIQEVGNRIEFEETLK